MAGELLAMILVPVAGGVAASVADRKFPNTTVSLGPVTLGVGALGAAAVIGAALLGVKLPGAKWLTLAATGAAIAEGVDIGQEQVLPYLSRTFPQLAPYLGSAPAAPAVQGEDYAGAGFLTTGLPESSFESALQALRA